MTPRGLSPDPGEADLNRFFQLVGFPAQAREWWNRFYEPDEVEIGRASCRERVSFTV